MFAMDSYAGNSWLQVKSNFSIPTIVYNFKSVLFH